MTNFKDFGLKKEIEKVLEEAGFLYPTEIQTKAIPLLLSSTNIDFHGQAQTGTGKTLAFSIPLLHRIDVSKRFVQAVVIAPTRELALQIFESINRLAKPLSIEIAIIYGGVSMEKQIDTLKRGVHIVIGTPGRIIDYIQRKILSLSQVKTFVLDEADIMLEMGFKEEIHQILSYIPEKKEIWLFSATVKPGIDEIKKSYMTEPVSVQVSKKQVATKKTKQYYCIVPAKSRLHAVMRFIQSATDFYGIIFCQTKILASELADELTKRGYNVGALHGDMSQVHRNMVIKKFKQKDFKILVATDVVARGIDVANLTHVINFSIPDDLESYVHRIGRTGRAGKEGTAITFISKKELALIHRIEKKFGVKIYPIDVPSRSMLMDIAIKEAADYIKSLKEKEKEKVEALVQLVESLSDEELRAVVQNVIYQKFIAILDLEEVPFTHVDEEVDELQEIFINLGAEDGIKKEQVRDYLLQTGLVNDDQIKKIRIIQRRTFIKLSADCTPELLTSLRSKTLAGRKVKVNMTCHVQGLKKEQGRRERRGSADSRGSVDKYKRR